MKVAIYHMTNNPKRTSCIPLEMNILRKYAAEQNWDVVEEFVDLTNIQQDKVELEKAISESSKYDVLLIKTAYYLSRNTETYIKILKSLSQNETRVFSIVDGWCS